jgi:hypothetical protein
VNTEPLLGTPTADINPLLLSTIFLQIANPNPVPLYD